MDLSDVASRGKAEEEKTSQRLQAMSDEVSQLKSELTELQQERDQALHENSLIAEALLAARTQQIKPPPIPPLPLQSSTLSSSVPQTGQIDDMLADLIQRVELEHTRHDELVDISNMIGSEIRAIQDHNRASGSKSQWQDRRSMRAEKLELRAMQQERSVSVLNRRRRHNIAQR